VLHVDEQHGEEADGEQEAGAVGHGEEALVEEAHVEHRVRAPLQRTTNAGSATAATT
jgi:hypothetical protein